MEQGIGCYYFSPLEGEDVLANDRSDFSSPYFLKAKEALRKIKALTSPSLGNIFPANYQEDAVQLSRKAIFKDDDWILAALSIDLDGNISRLLLVSVSYHQEGLVVSFSDYRVLVSFYRGFSISEFLGEPSLNGEDFLTSIGIKEAVILTSHEVEVPLYFDYGFNDEEEDSDEEEEIPVISIQKPVFEAGGKRKIANLGSYVSSSETSQNDDEEVHIEVAKPSFQASSHGKPRNLGNFVDPSKIVKEEEPVGPIEVEKPSFEARSSKKPMNLDAPKKRPVPIAKPIVEPKKVATPEIEKPVIPEPVPSKADEIKPEEPIVVSKVETPSFEAAKKGRIHNYDKEVEKQERHWKETDIYKIKPDVYHGERSLILKSGNQEGEKLYSSVSSLLSSLKTMPASDHLLFVPNILKESDPHFKDLFRFDLAKWKAVCLVVDKLEDPLSVLLSKIEEPSFCLLISLSSSPLVEVMSLTGAALDDRALPYLNFEQLLKASS